MGELLPWILKIMVKSVGFGRGFLGFIQPEQTRGKNFLLFVDWKSSYNEELLILVVVFAYGAGVRATLPTCETCVPLTNYVPLGQLLFCSSVPLLQCLGNIAYFLGLFGGIQLRNHINERLRILSVVSV